MLGFPYQELGDENNYTVSDCQPVLLRRKESFRVTRDRESLTNSLLPNEGENVFFLASLNQQCIQRTLSLCPYSCPKDQVTTTAGRHHDVSRDELNHWSISYTKRKKCFFKNPFSWPNKNLSKPCNSPWADLVPFFLCHFFISLFFLSVFLFLLLFLSFL